MGSGASRPPRGEGNEDRKPKAAKIPLNIALVAIVKIQVRFRMRLAKRRFEAIRAKVMEERRLEELARKAKIPERDELVPLRTGALDYLNKNDRLSIRNRFMRKVAQEQRVKLAGADETEFESAIETDPALVMGKYAPHDEQHCVVYPLVGFVIKSRSNITGQKFFLNICHHETVATMVATQVREVADTPNALLSRDSSNNHLPPLGSTGRPFTATSSMFNTSQNNGESGHLHGHGPSETILIGDVILPSREFEECFKYDEDEGLAPVTLPVRAEIARQAIKYWNLCHGDDIASNCSFPKIKRGYFGDLLPLVLDVKYRSVAHAPAVLRESTAVQTKVMTTNKMSDTLSSFLLPASESPKDRFRLPFVPQLRCWVDTVTVGKRVALVENAVPITTPIVALAVIEPTIARKTAVTHPLTFTSRVVPAGVVELVVPAPVPTGEIPLFGPAYAAQMLAALEASTAASTVPETPTAGSSAAAATAPASALQPKEVPVAPLTPHTPSSSKTARSVTMGPGSAAPAAHRHLSAPGTGAAWVKSQAGSAASAASSATPGTPTPAAPATQPTAIAGAGAVSMMKGDLAGAAAAAVASLNAALLTPEVTECNSHLPIFLVLSAGVLYAYNRDPHRNTYFPRSHPQPAPKEPEPKRGHNVRQDEEAKPDPVLPPNDAVLPLIQYARIMLTEDCVQMSTISTPQGTVWRVRVNAPKSDKSSPEDAIASLYTELHELFASTGVTFSVRSYSEFRTLKAHLRSHIQLGAAVRHRVVSDYVAGQTVVNDQILSKRLLSKAGEVTHYPTKEKRFLKIDHGLLYVYQEKHPTEFAGRKLLKTINLADKMAIIRNEMLPDNSSQNILSVLDGAGQVVDGLEFTFHKPYAMDESESREFWDYLQRHAHLAHTRMCCYLLPLVETEHGAVVMENKSNIVTVKMTVSSTEEEMDSDDEDGDETEHALRKHTLLTILYLSHPSPLEEVHRKVVALLGPDPATTAATSATAGAGVSMTAADSPAAPSPAAAASPVVSHSEFKASATTQQWASGAPDSTQTVHTIGEMEALQEVTTTLQHNTIDIPAYDVVLVGHMLFFYHNMRFYFALDCLHCGDKSALRAARAWEKNEIVHMKQDILRAREKNSVYYLDSSSDEDGDDEQSNPSFHIPLSRLNSRGSLVDPTSPPQSASQPHRHGHLRHRQHRGKRPIKTIDAAAPVVAEPVPVYVARPRVLAESKAPENYPIKAWVIQLVCYDNRTYTLRFKSEADYQQWRTLLFSAGRDVTETVFMAKHPPASAPQHAHTVHAEGHTVFSAEVGGDKEDSLQHPETTSSAAELALSEIDTNNGGGAGGGGPGSASSSIPPLLRSAVSAKLDRGFDLDATRKFARMLRKEEKVLSVGQVFKHDAISQTKFPPPPGTAPPVSKQRRILVLTDAPRLLFLDPVGNIVRGALDIASTPLLEVKLVSTAEFDVVIGGMVNKFTSTELPDKNAVFWASKIKQAVANR